MYSSESTTSTKLCYFVAGALLPTLAYFLLSLSKRKSSFSNNGRDGKLSSDSDSDDDLQEQLGEPSNDPGEWGMRDCPYKMVLCVNKELKMGKGKIAAQCCHAAVECYKRAGKRCPSALSAWEISGCAKVAVQCETQSEMEEILRQAKNLGLPCYLVEDAGRTQIAAGSRTVYQKPIRLENLVRMTGVNPKVNKQDLQVILENVAVLFSGGTCLHYCYNNEFVDKDEIIICFQRHQLFSWNSR